MLSTYLYRITGVFLCACGVFGCATGAEKSASFSTTSPTTRSVDRLNAVFGRDGVSAVQEAERVEIAILGAYSSSSTPGTTRPGNVIANQNVVARKIIRDAATLSKFARLLEDRQSYRFNQESFISRPKFAIQFVRKDAIRRTFSFDFEDDIVRVDEGVEEDPFLPHEATLFSPMRPQLVRLLQSSWPDQTEIRSLSSDGNRLRRALTTAAYDVVEHADQVECIRILPSKDWRVMRWLAVNPQFYAYSAFADTMNFTLDPEMKKLRRPPGILRAPDSVGGYPVSARGPPPDQKLTHDLCATLLDDDVYPRGLTAVAGCFDPGVAYRFHHAGRNVTLLICFHCGNLVWTTEGFAPSADPRICYSGFSHQGWKQVAELTKRAFPKDDEI